MRAVWLGALALGLAVVAGPAAAQAAGQGAASPGVAWEQMPLLPYYGDPRLIAEALAALPPEPGREGGPPFRLYVASRGLLVYDPGQTTQPERYGPWLDTCYGGSCGPDDIVATEDGSLIVADQEIGRSTDGGVTWAEDVGGSPLHQGDVVFQPRAAARDGDGRAPVLAARGSTVIRSYGDGAAGTWEQATTADGPGAGGEVIAFGEVPPSAALPNGRLLAGVWNGVTVSDDGGATWRPGEGAYGFARFLGYAFAFTPEPGHPYGGAVLAGLDDLAFGRDSSATVYRSDDGGGTWARTHRFSPAALGLPNANVVELATTPDGAVWAGITHELGGSPTERRAAVARSVDVGRTWAPASAGVDLRRIYELMVGPDDRLYAATAVGVWRTAGPAWAVSEEASPPASALSVAVWPNPTSSGATVAVSERARVEVVDALGRAVVAWDSVDDRVEVDTAGWATGAYLVRTTTARGARATAGLVVAR